MDTCPTCGDKFNSVATHHYRAHNEYLKPEGVNPPKPWGELSTYQRYYYRNKDAERERIKARKDRIKEYIDDQRKAGECQHCGYKDYRALDFHHVEEKEYKISEIHNRGVSMETVKDELDKCILLCANCHRIHHR